MVLLKLFPFLAGAGAYVPGELLFPEALTGVQFFLSRFFFHGLRFLLIAGMFNFFLFELQPVYSVEREKTESAAAVDERNCSEKSSRVIVRVGAVAAEDFDEEFIRWKKCFRWCSEQTEGRLRFVIAPGTYGDLIYWMDSGMIDIAIVTPGIFAESRKSLISGGNACIFDYLVTPDTRPARGDWAPPERKREGHHYSYRSVCAVSKYCPWRTVEDLKRAAMADRVEFVFVDPLSCSGRIAPEYALRQMGIVPQRNRILYTYSHTGSLRALANHRAGEGRERVGFVWDDAISMVEQEVRDGVRRLEFPFLDSLVMPNDVIAVRRGFPEKELVQKLMCEYRDENGNLLVEKLPGAETSYDVIIEWARTLGINRWAPEMQTVSIEEIAQSLIHSARFQPQPPRLALVLSGGGAKCSYQVGAVAAIEEMLEKMRQTSPDSKIDIELVVGTSGGAINAIPIALGVTKSKEGREDFEKLWISLDQREIVRPSKLIRGLIGVWIAILEMTLVYILVRLSIHPQASGHQNRAYWFIRLMFALALCQQLCEFIPQTPWKFLGKNHVLHHIWLWFSFGVGAASLPVLFLSTLALITDIFLRRKGRQLYFSMRQVIPTMIGLLFLLPALTAGVLLFHEKTLSGDEGLEEVLARSFRWLIDRELIRRGMSPLSIPAGANAREQLDCTGKEIFERNLLVRDIIVTGNCLAQTKQLLPSDLYFYAGRDEKCETFGARGIELGRYPSLLFDIVMGSGCIFPLFPARELMDFPEKDVKVELIDGGFAHNSPIEAAVLRGATHIILIEATPPRFGPGRNLAGNAAAAIAHLHKQTQLIDLRSKRHVVVFSLHPRPPHLCVLDFADNLLSDSIRRGYRDARGELMTANGIVKGEPSFRKELGEPVFVSLP